MPLAMLMTAMFTGLVLSLIWLLTGGTALAALGIYALSGNLAMAAMIVAHTLRAPR
jgi:hypothetical protein